MGNADGEDVNVQNSRPPSVHLDEEETDADDTESLQVEFREAKRHVKTSRALFSKAVTRLTTMLESGASPEQLVKARAALDSLTESKARLNRDTDRLLRSPLFSEEARSSEEEKELEYEEKFEEIAHALREYIRVHSPAATGHEDVRFDPQGLRNRAGGPFCSTMTSEPTSTFKNSWKDILQRIPRFDGDTTKFARWKEAFVLHVDAKDFNKLEKFDYLLKTLSGEALKTISSWRIAAENYEGARDTIYVTFGDIALAEFQHVKKIIAACNRKDLDQNDKFKFFVQEVVQNLECLVTLGNTYEGMSPFPAAMIVDALNDERRLRFFGDYNIKEEKSCILKELLDFLRLEAKKAAQVIAIARNYGERKGKDTHGGSRPFDEFRKKFDKKKSNPAGETGQSSSQYSFALGSPPVDHSCIFCSGKHDSSRCKEKMSPEDRRKRATTENACFICLNRQHRAAKCKIKYTCPNCQGKHSVLLCVKSEESKASANAAVVNISASARSSADQEQSVSGSKLPTGYVEAIGEKGATICRIVLDTGSQKTLITSAMADRLGAKQVGTENFYLQSAGYARPRRMKGKIVEFTLKSRFSNQRLMLQATALQSVIEGEIPNANFKGGLEPMADRNEAGWPSRVNILVGVDHLYPILGGGVKKVGGFIALETIFGYFICGSGLRQDACLNPGLAKAIKAKRESWSSRVGKERTPTVNSLAAVVKQKYDPEDISFLWETEVMGIEPYVKEIDEAPNEELNRFFKETTTRKPDGRYVIHLPFKPNKAALGDNKRLTENRLKSFLAQAKRNPSLLEAVDREMADLLEQGFIELATAPKPDEPAHYLPLLAVVKKAATVDSPMKVRVVNDAGARSKNQAAINDTLFQGENLIADLIAVLLQFRQTPVAITADVEKAYLQFEITPEHRTFLRFLWPLGISKNRNAPVREMNSCRLSFGLISAPFLHCAGIKYHLDNEIVARPQHKKLLEFVKKYFYIDDLYVGAYSANEGKKKVETLIEVFSAGCFPLKKWATNSADVAKFIQERHPEFAVTFEDVNFKFLGARWNQKLDTMHVDVSKVISFLKSSVPSKRTVLKAVSQIFDPLGLVAPISVGFKKILQTLWRKKLDWDDELRGDELSEFLEQADKLRHVTEIKVKRNFCQGGKYSAKHELHLFCDSSLSCYGAAAYVRDVSKDGKVSVTLVMSKARVTPLKGNWSIHRLELLGAVVASRLAKKIVENASEPFSSVNFWCDNACVLAWIRDKPDRWRTFVEHRVRELQANSNPSQWRYVKSQDNPSDLLSRSSALHTRQLRDFWLSGPTWLATAGEPPEHELNPRESEAEVTCERRPQCFVGAAATRKSPEHIGIKAVSSWTKAVRIVAYIRRWKYIKNVPAGGWTVSVDSQEFQQAELVIIKNIQANHFSVEIESGLSELSKSSPIYQYNPFIDKDGIIRCRSRLQKAEELSYETMNPIILPGEDSLVELYVRFVHEKVCGHAGSIQGILHRVRQRFLILRVRRAAKKAISRCKVCVKYRATPAAEPTPPLPKFRIETVPAFSVTAVDAAGPIPVKDPEGNIVSAYIMMFCCPVTRAVRLELVPNLSTREFLFALRRFYNRNPYVSRFFSDNAASFRRAAKEVKLLFDLSRADGTQSFLAEHRITWQWNVERAPWRAGWYERMFGTIKRPLRKIIGKAIPPFREFEVVVTDIELLVNSRPLTHLSANPNELLPLTPADLVHGIKARPMLPETKEVLEAVELKGPIVLSERWKFQQNLVSAFWNRYRREYLQQLRSAHAAKPIQSRPLKVGDVVLIDDPASSRARWPMARVQSLSGGGGTDGKQRTCVIRLPSGKTLTRPIQLLYPLDLDKF